MGGYLSRLGIALLPCRCLASEVLVGCHAFVTWRKMAVVSTRRMEITMCFAFRLRFRLPANCFYKTLTPSAGVCILRLAILSRRPSGKLPSSDIRNTVKDPLDYLNSWPARHLKIQ